MRYSNAVLNRARDILAELEGNPCAYFSEKQLREVIDDDNWAMVIVEKGQLDDLRQKRMEKEGWTFEKLFSNCLAHRSKLLEERGYVKQQQGRLSYWEGKRDLAERYIRNHNRAIAAYFDSASSRWAALTDQEKAAFGPSPVNPIDVFDFPVGLNEERAIFYPEPTASVTVVIEKLRHMIGVLERELAKEDGK